VFAIAITLLVIDLRVPSLGRELSDPELTAALGELRMRVFAYVLSFIVIGVYWHAHWRGFRELRRVDERLVLMNLALLGAVAFIPFPTALIGEYGDRAIAVVIYAVSLSIAGILSPLQWLYAQRAGLVPPEAPRVRRMGAIRALLLPGAMLASLLLLPFVPTVVVEATWFAVVPLQIAVTRLLR
jgi:uncharacterized membrane protein